MEILRGRLEFKTDSNLSEITKTTDGWSIVTLRYASCHLSTMHHARTASRPMILRIFSGIDAMHGDEFFGVGARWTLTTFWFAHCTSLDAGGMKTGHAVHCMQRGQSGNCMWAVSCCAKS
jgi:hypothetical protein